MCCSFATVGDLIELMLITRKIGCIERMSEKADREMVFTSDVCGAFPTLW